jgi:hypothetical protein
MVARRWLAACARLSSSLAEIVLLTSKEPR